MGGRTLYKRSIANALLAMQKRLIVLVKDNNSVISR